MAKMAYYINVSPLFRTIPTSNSALAPLAKSFLATEEDDPPADLLKIVAANFVQQFFFAEMVRHKDSIYVV